MLRGYFRKGIKTHLLIQWSALDTDCTQGQLLKYAIAYKQVGTIAFNGAGANNRNSRAWGSHI